MRSDSSRPARAQPHNLVDLSEKEAGALAERLERVRARIAAAAQRAGRRPEDVTLVAAVKGVQPSAIHAAAQRGVKHFGENYVQEGEAKRAALGSHLPPEVRWHLLGHLQTNKAGAAVDIFDIIQTVDSLRVAEAISRRAARDAKPVLLEVKFGVEPQRFGFAPEQVAGAVAALRSSTGLAIQGLMTVVPLNSSAGETRHIFRRLRELRDRLASEHPDLQWPHLSMGMSDDYEIAIEEGATMVRIGRAIFGERPAK